MAEVHAIAEDELGSVLVPAGSTIRRVATFLKIVLSTVIRLCRTAQGEVSRFREGGNSKTGRLVFCSFLYFLTAKFLEVL